MAGHCSRFLMVTQGFPPQVGGIQAYAEGTARALAGLVGELSVLVPPGCGDGDRIVAVPGPESLMPLSVFPGILWLARKGKIDAVLCASWQLAPAALLARRLGLVDSVYCAAHGRELLNFPCPAPMKPLYKALRAWALRSLDGTFPVSRYTAGLLQELGVNNERIKVVPNGVTWRQTSVEPEQVKSRYGPASKPLLLTVTRLIERKGVDTVLRALAQLHGEGVDFLYLIAGDGPQSEQLQSLAEELGIAAHCRFLGRLSDQERDELYSACTVFVMTPRQVGPSVEGFGIVFREANLFGKPVVGSRTGGVPDAIEEGRNGLLVPPDDPDALAQALGQLIEQPEFAQRLGEQGRELVRTEGSWEMAAARMLEVMG